MINFQELQKYTEPDISKNEYFSAVEDCHDLTIEELQKKYRETKAELYKFQKMNIFDQLDNAKKIYIFCWRKEFIGFQIKKLKKKNYFY